MLDDNEHLMIMKTTEKRLSELKETIAKNHPYECPEIIVTEAQESHPALMQWVHDECKKEIK